MRRTAEVGRLTLAEPVPRYMLLMYVVYVDVVAVAALPEVF